MELKSKVAIITGAGAVENAWTPILKILGPMNNFRVDADAANCFFARRIYLLRAYSKYSDDKAVENLKNELGIVKSLKELICDCIKMDQHQGVLKVRKEFEIILSSFVFSNPENLFGFITTNWDTTVDREANEIVKKYFKNLNNIKCFHVHGSIESPDALYLPSETSHENYRTDEDNKLHGYNHYLTLKFLEEANKIIFYGVSLDPLDAELTQIVSSAFSTSQNLKEIVIVNPDFNRIRNRIMLLLYPKKNINIKCFVPEDLDHEV